MLLLAVGLRVAHLVDTTDSPFFTRPIIDGRAYDTWALAIRDGTASTAPFYQDPLYPHFLALVYALFGHSFLAVYVLQLLLGVAVTMLVFDTTRLLFDRRAAVIAGLLVAVYRPFMFYEGMIEKTALAVFLTTLFLWALTRSLKSTRAAWPALTGLALGLAALTRANLLVFAPLLVVLYLWHGTRRRWSRALLATAGLLLVIAPVAIRNSVVAREPVLTTTQAGQNFYIGNGPHNRTGQYEAPSWIRANPMFEQQDARAYAENRAGHALSYSGISRFYFALAFRRLRDDPGGFLTLIACKALLYVNNTEVPDNQDLGFFSRYSGVLRLPLPGFGILFALGFAGMLLWFRRSRPHLAQVIFFAGYGATVVAFFVLARYRLPAVPALVPFAGGLAVWTWDRARSRRFRPVAAMLALTVGCLLLTFYPLRRGDRRNEHAQCLVNLASVYYHEGDTLRAVATYEEALFTAPGHGEASRNLGIVMFNRGNLARARELLEQAARANPDNPVTRYHLGRIHEIRGRLDAALTEYDHCTRLRPDELKYGFAGATVLQRLDRHSEALARYDAMLHVAPDDPRIHHNRAVALFNLNRYKEARAALDRTRNLGGPVNPTFERALNARGR
jgi:4-amino-4-deoxy-L-arabinose transferase-like glycosyltransferase